MRKWLGVVLSIAVLLGLTTCGAGSAAPRKDIIALCLPSLDNPLMLEFQRVFTQEFGDAYKVEVASADSNPNTQATQVENFTAMKAKLIFALAIETSSLVPKLEAARAAGVKVLIGGSEPGRSARDAVMKMDQFLAGEYCAQMAKEWVEKRFSNAPAGSVEAALLISSVSEEDVNRVNGLKMIAEPYLRNNKWQYVDATGTPISDSSGKFLPGKSKADRAPNPVYCPVLEVVATPEAAMFQPGQIATQNILTSHPKVRIIIAYASDGACGASQVIMDDYGKATGRTVKSIDEMGVFGVGMFGPEGDTLKESSKGKGVLRGCVAFGGGDLPGQTVALAKKMVSGEPYPEVTWDPLAKVTAVNGELVVVQVPSSGIIGVK